MRLTVVVFPSVPVTPITTIPFEGNKNSKFQKITTKKRKTFFMYRLLDIVVLDRKGKIVKVRESLKPNRLFFWHPRYSYIIEAPAGLIKELKLDLGNILRFSL